MSGQNGKGNKGGAATISTEQNNNSSNNSNNNSSIGSSKPRFTIISRLKYLYSMEPSVPVRNVYKYLFNGKHQENEVK